MLDSKIKMTELIIYCDGECIITRKYYYYCPIIVYPCNMLYFFIQLSKKNVQLKTLAMYGHTMVNGRMIGNGR